MTPAEIAAMQADALAGTQGDWFVAGVRFKMNNSEWLGIMRYDEALRRDENIAAVGYDPRTGLGWPDASRFARVPRMETTIITLTETNAAQSAEIVELRAALLRYGEHSPSCDLGKSCQCGFFDTLKGTPK